MPICDVTSVVLPFVKDVAQGKGMKVFVQSNMLIAQNFLSMRGSWQVVHYSTYTSANVNSGRRRQL